MRRIRPEIHGLAATFMGEDSTLTTYYYTRDLDADTDKPLGPWRKMRCDPLAPVVDCGAIEGDPPGYTGR